MEERGHYGEQNRQDKGDEARPTRSEDPRLISVEQKLSGGLQGPMESLVCSVFHWKPNNPGRFCAFQQLGKKHFAREEHTARSILNKAPTVPLQYGWAMPPLVGLWSLQHATATSNTSLVSHH